MANTDAARKAWETRRAKAAAAAQGIPYDPTTQPRRRPPPVQSASSPAALQARATRTDDPSPEKPKPAPKPTTSDPEARFVGNFRLDTQDYVRRYRKQPAGMGKFTFIVSGRGKYGGVHKFTDGPFEMDFEAVIEKAAKAASENEIGSGLIRILP